MDVRLFGVKVKKLVLLRWCVIFLMYGLSLWFLWIIRIVVSLLVVFVGLIRQLLIWLWLFGDGQVMCCVFRFGLLGVICWVSVQFGDSWLSSMVVVNFLIVNLVVLFKNFCFVIFLWVQQLQRLSSFCGKFLVIIWCIDVILFMIVFLF